MENLIIYREVIGIEINMSYQLTANADLSRLRRSVNSTDERFLAEDKRVKLFSSAVFLTKILLGF